MMFTRFSIAALVVAFMQTLAGSSPAQEPAPAPPPVDLTGCWSGTWRSCSTGHNGPLHATFCKVCDNTYQVTFRGRFFKVLPFRYTVNLDVVGYEGDKVLLAGSADLGRFFGTFHYDAEATACEFRANYRSCRDHGVFCLQRACCH